MFEKGRYNRPFFMCVCECLKYRKGKKFVFEIYLSDFVLKCDLWRLRSVEKIKFSCS